MLFDYYLELKSQKPAPVKRWSTLKQYTNCFNPYKYYSTVYVHITMIATNAAPLSGEGNVPL